MIKAMTRSQADTPRFVYVAASIAALGGLLFGYDLVVISGAILFIKEQFALSPTIEEVVVSAVVFGAMIGAAMGGALADRFGRRVVLILTAATFALGVLGTALASTVTWLIVGRVVVGLGVGMVSMATPLYISEISPDNARGRLVSLFMLLGGSGSLIAFLVDYAFSTFHSWRWMFGLAVIPALIFGIGMWLLPESPRWLASHGLVDRARTVLGRIRAMATVEDELQSIQSGLGQRKGGWAELTSSGVRPALIVGMGLGISQRVTGVNLGFFYAPTIFELAGFESASVDILASVGLGVTMVVMTMVAIQLIDRVGRRPLLLIGFTGMVLSLGALGLAFVVPRGSLLGWIAVGSLMLLVGSWMVGPGTVSFLLISEIYPLKIRGLAMSIATVVLWSSYLLVTLTFLTLIETLGRAGTFWLYGLLGIGAWLFVYFLVPETKGKSLEEIQAHWQAGKHPRAMGT
jgi:MFS transporter, SP family, galactose:H+ symporter